MRHMRVGLIRDLRLMWQIYLRPEGLLSEVCLRITFWLWWNCQPEGELWEQRFRCPVPVCAHERQFVLRDVWCQATEADSQPHISTPNLNHWPQPLGQIDVNKTKARLWNSRGMLPVLHASLVTIIVLPSELTISLTLTQAPNDLFVTQLG